MNLYILVDPDKPDKCKIGISKDCNQRIRAYRTAAPSCFYQATYVVENARKHEKEIISIFKDICRVQSEYVHCSPSIAQNIVEGYFQDNDIDF